MASEPQTRTASTTVERLQLVGDWLDYLSGAAGGGESFIVFQSPTGRYVQFAFDPQDEKVRVEVGTFEWQTELGGAIPARAEERLAGRDFNAPDRGHANFWQDVGQFRSRSLSSVTEWAFRDVFAEPADFRLSVSAFETYGTRPEIRVDSQSAAPARPSQWLDPKKRLVDRVLNRGYLLDLRPVLVSQQAANLQCAVLEAEALEERAGCMVGLVHLGRRAVCCLSRTTRSSRMGND